MLILWILETLWRHRSDEDFKIRIYSSFGLLAIAMTAVALNLSGVSRLWVPFDLQTNFWSRSVTLEMWPMELQWYWIIGSVVALGTYCWWSSAPKVGLCGCWHRFLLRC
jgi:hypothetical protein